MDSATVVMKFGGTSVADAERLKRAAQRIVAKREAGHRVVAVAGQGHTAILKDLLADDPQRQGEAVGGYLE